MIPEINSDVFEKDVLDADRPVVVDVWAPWCGPCRVQAPIFETAAQQLGDKVLFVKLNADDNQELVQPGGKNHVDR